MSRIVKLTVTRDSGDVDMVIFDFLEGKLKVDELGSLWIDEGAGRPSAYAGDEWTSVLIENLGKEK